MDRSIPQRELPGGLQTIPNVAADLIAVDAFVFQIVATNTTAASATITITDKQSPAKTLISAANVDPGVPFVAVFPLGVKMTGGINWVCSAASAVDAEVYGVYTG